MKTQQRTNWTTVIHLHKGKVSCDVTHTETEKEASVFISLVTSTAALGPTAMPPKAYRASRSTAPPISDNTWWESVINLIPHLLLILQLYNSLWVLACSVISFHFFLSCILCFQLFTPIFLKSLLTSSSHLTLGLRFGLVAYGFHLYMVLATLSLVILSTCHNQLNRLYFMYILIYYRY